MKLILSILSNLYVSDSIASIAKFNTYGRQCKISS